MAFEFVQILYWLALSTWFGGVLFVLVAPPIILRTVRENNPLLPHVLSVNLDGQHGTLLAGSIVSNLLGPIVRVELACAAGMLVAIIGQWIVADTYDLIQPIIRSALYVAAVGLLIYDWRYLWPRVIKSREEYLENADNPDVANPALDRFDQYQAESQTVLRSTMFILLAIILFSAAIRQGSLTIAFPK